MDTTLLKGLTVLEALAHSKEPRGVTDLSAELGLLKSNVHRVLQTLIHAGYVRKDPDSGRYECTLKLWTLGGMVAERLDVRYIARPHMKALAAETSEAVHLSMLEGVDLLYIERVESSHPVRVQTSVSGRSPARCISSGKVLLAYGDEALFQAATANMVAYTSKTVTDPEVLRKELRRIRTVGYVVNRGEYREGVAGIGAPIFDGRGGAIAGLGISGPNERLNAARVRELLPKLVAAAQAISRDCGYGQASAKMKIAG